MADSDEETATPSTDNECSEEEIDIELAESMEKMVEQLRRLLIVGRTLANGNNVNLMPAFKDSIGGEGDEVYDNLQLLQAAKNWTSMEDLPLVIEAEIDDAIACFDGDTEVIESVEEIGDSESEASSSGDEEFLNPSDGMRHISGLRRFLKETNGSKEASNLLTQLENRMRQDRAGRNLSQPNLLNYWSKR